MDRGLEDGDVDAARGEMERALELVMLDERFGSAPYWREQSVNARMSVIAYATVGVGQKVAVNERTCVGTRVRVGVGQNASLSASVRAREIAVSAWLLGKK